jgi:hypothetical protein
MAMVTEGIIFGSCCVGFIYTMVMYLCRYEMDYSKIIKNNNIIYQHIFLIVLWIVMYYINARDDIIYVVMPTIIISATITNYYIYTIFCIKNKLLECHKYNEKKIF